jgi:hypothetical protein
MGTVSFETANPDDDLQTRLDENGKPRTCRPGATGADDQAPFASDVQPGWREAFGVLRRGGVLLAGFCNPALDVFDDALAGKGELVVPHAVPYSDRRPTCRPARPS